MRDVSKRPACPQRSRSEPPGEASFFFGKRRLVVIRIDTSSKFAFLEGCRVASAIVAGQVNSGVFGVRAPCSQRLAHRLVRNGGLLTTESFLMSLFLNFWRSGNRVPRNGQC